MYYMYIFTGKNDKFVIEQSIKFLYRVWQRISNAIKDILFFYFNIHARTRYIETYCVDNQFLIVLNCARQQPMLLLKCKIFIYRYIYIQRSYIIYFTHYTYYFSWRIMFSFPPEEYKTENIKWT